MDRGKKGGNVGRKKGDLDHGRSREKAESRGMSTCGSRQGLRTAGGEGGNKRERGDVAASPRALLPPNRTPQQPGGEPGLLSDSPRDGAAQGDGHSALLRDSCSPLPGAGNRSSATGRAGESSPINASIKAH